MQNLHKGKTFRCTANTPAPLGFTKGQKSPTGGRHTVPVGTGVQHQEDTGQELWLLNIPLVSGEAFWGGRRVEEGGEGAELGRGGVD